VPATPEEEVSPKEEVLHCGECPLKPIFEETFLNPVDLYRSRNLCDVHGASSAQPSEVPPLFPEVGRLSPDTNLSEAGPYPRVEFDVWLQFTAPVECDMRGTCRALTWSK
jgi:hypothetical protein